MWVCIIIILLYYWSNLIKIPFGVVIGVYNGNVTKYNFASCWLSYIIRGEI